MENIQQIQFNLMLMLSGICFMTIIFTSVSKSLPVRRRRILILMEINAILLLMMERFFYTFSGVTTMLGLLMVKISNFYIFIAPFILILLFARFIGELLTVEGGLNQTPVSIKVVEMVCLAAMVLVMISQFTGLYYTIDEKNLYHRAPTYILSYVPVIIVFTLLFYSVIRYGKKLSKNIQAGLHLFLVIPMAATMVQLFVPTVSVISLSLVLPILLLFVIELRDMNEKLDRANAQLIDHLNAKQDKTYHELVVALEEAKAANEAKSNFLSNISHDLRTPMNAIIGFMDMAISHEYDPAMVLECVHKTKMASDQLLSLINDVLDMSKIERGKIELTMAPTSLWALGDNLRSIFSDTAAKNGVNFLVDTENIHHDWITTDRKYLDRILMNIVSNALKFTPRNGHVSLTMEETEGKKDEKTIYRFTVTDDGIGMSEEFQKKIFDPFERERTSTVSGLQGTGLGMSIVKKLVEQFGGSIEIDSAEGKGTTIRVIMPMEQTQAPKATDTFADPKEKILLEGRHILLVDDVSVNREVARMILGEQKIQVDEAVNGQEAVEIFREHPDRYDAILMDIQMPIMNGYDAARAIRELDTVQARNIPIIAMTANAFTEDKQRAIEAGMNDHVAKPINIAQLYKTLESLIA